MHFFKLVALTGFFASAAFAAPSAEPNDQPPKPAPPPPTNPNQSNACGNGAAPFCCTTDKQGKYTSCYSFQFSSQCSQTTVCCNASNSVQVCVGTAEIVAYPGN